MTIIEADKSVKADSSKLDSSKTDSSKVTEVKKNKKVSNATQDKLRDLIKSNKNISLDEALKKIFPGLSDIPPSGPTQIQSVTSKTPAPNEERNLTLRKADYDKIKKFYKKIVYPLCILFF